jgi:hypothetical protein
MSWPCYICCQVSTTSIAYTDISIITINSSLRLIIASTGAENNALCSLLNCA